MQHAHFAARAQYVGPEDRTFHILLGEQALNTHLGGPRSCEASFAGCWTRWICRACLWGLSRPVPHLGVYPEGGFSIFDDHRVEVEGYRGAETIIDQDRVDLFRKALGLLHPSAVYGSGCPGPDHGRVGDELTARGHEWVRLSWSHCSSSVSAGSALPSGARRWTGMSWEAHASSCSATR